MAKDKTPEQDYEIGYGRPPREHQFGKGQKVNRNGRPKGAKNRKPKSEKTLASLVIKEAERKIAAQENGETIKIPVIRAALRALGVNAVKGSVQAQRLLFALVEKAEEVVKLEGYELFMAAVEYKQYYQRNPQLLSTALPKPEHVLLNLQEGTVKFTGPIDEPDRRLWEELWERLEICRVGLTEAEYAMQNDPIDEEFAVMEDEDFKVHLHLYLVTAATIMLGWHRSVSEVIEDPRFHQLANAYCKQASEANSLPKWQDLQMPF